MTVFFQEARDKLLRERISILSAQFVNYRGENSERRLEITRLNSRLTMLPVPFSVSHVSLSLHQGR